jgi:hypothetical protein
MRNRHWRFNGMLGPEIQGPEIRVVMLGAICECGHFEGAHFHGHRCQGRILEYGCLVVCRCMDFHEQGTPRRCGLCKGPTEVPADGRPAALVCARCMRPTELVIRRRMAAFNRKQERERYL